MKRAISFQCVCVCVCFGSRLEYVRDEIGHVLTDGSDFKLEVSDLFAAKWSVSQVRAGFV